PTSFGSTRRTWDIPSSAISATVRASPPPRRPEPSRPPLRDPSTHLCDRRAWRCTPRAWPFLTPRGAARWRWSPPGPTSWRPGGQRWAPSVRVVDFVATLRRIQAQEADLALAAGAAVHEQRVAVLGA